MRILPRALRRHLRSVRYHAASRPDTPWHRWRDRLLLLSIPLAIPLMLLLESSVRRSFVIAEVRGGFVGPVGGPYIVGLADDPESTIQWPPGAQQGTFHLRAVDRLHGWPLTTSVVSDSAVLDLSWFRETADRFDERPGVDSEVGRALVRVFRHPDIARELRPEIRQILDHWQRTGSLPNGADVRRYWPGTIAAVLTGWLALSVLSVVGIASARYTWRLLSDSRELRRDRNRRRGRCAACGFDLRGNVFSERCPECGTLSE